MASFNIGLSTDKQNVNIAANKIEKIAKNPKRDGKVGSNTATR